MLRVFLLLLLLLAAGLGAVLCSEQGTHWLLRTAQRYLPLELEYASGSLAGRLQLKRLLYQSVDLRVELDDLVLEVAPECLWRSVICLKQLGAR
ncbi:MAG: hypothetical protein R3E50_01910, partial [Halioglobus sp.]